MKKKNQRSELELLAAEAVKAAGERVRIMQGKIRRLESQVRCLQDELEKERTGRKTWYDKSFMWRKDLEVMKMKLKQVEKEREFFKEKFREVSRSLALDVTDKEMKAIGEENVSG